MQGTGWGGQVGDGGGEGHWNEPAGKGQGGVWGQGPGRPGAPGQMLGSGQRSPTALPDPGRAWRWGLALAQPTPWPRQESTLRPKCLRSCSRKTNVSTVCGMRRMPAGTRPWAGKGEAGSQKTPEGPPALPPQPCRLSPAQPCKRPAARALLSLQRSERHPAENTKQSKAIKERLLLA